MKISKSKYLFKAFALVFALAFTVLFLPINEFTTWAQIGKEYTDYSYMRIGKEGETVKNTVYVGDEYTIANGYIGGSDSFVIGKTPSGELSSGVQLTASAITVTYGDVYSSESEKVDVPVQDKDGVKVFTAEKEGNYTVTYSYSYTMGGKTYTNYYDMTVESKITDAAIDIENNHKNVLPSIIDLSLMKTESDSSYTDFALPIPTITDEDGKEVEGVKVVIDSNQISSAEDVVLVKVTGGAQVKDLKEYNYLTMNEAGDVVVDGAVFKDTENGFAGDMSTYTVKYSYYHNGQFVRSTTKSTTVYDSYYKNYNANNLDIETSSDLTTTAQPGIEQTLPGISVTTNKNVTPSEETVDVYYTVEVRYRASGSVGYQKIDVARYNEGKDEDEKVFNEDGTLIDPTKFTPLDEGYYTFIYTATDFYGNVISTDEGEYEWRNIKDTTEPTAVVYDASVKETDGTPTYEDASHKLKTQAYPNSVIVYAIGIDDNLSKQSDADLKRIVYANSEELFTIEDYDAYNLVFNYRASAGADNNAYSNLLTNNYLIRKAIAEEGKTDSINSDATMLTWLKEHGYLIVIDNANADKIYSYFTETFNTIGSISSLDEFKTWVKNSENKEALINQGFAYINTDKTFGANSSSDGFNYSSYELRYWAKDKAGNSSYISRSMTLSSQYDTTAPKISMSTSLNDAYLPTEDVTFAAPTASDDTDSSSRMKVVTYYRFLDSENAPIEVLDEDDTPISTNDTTGVFTDADANQDKTDENGVAYTKKYEAYKGAGYVDLTDASATEYTIDLSLGGSTAEKVQIFVFTYDDSGNVGIYGVEFNVAQSIDAEIPQLKEVNINETRAEFEQGAEISLPTLTVKDDRVDYMNFNINVYPLEEDGTRASTPIKPVGFKQDWNKYDYLYTVQGGTFRAPFVGDYVAAMEVKDSANNTIVVFTHYTVDQTLDNIQDPVIKTSLENQTVELDDKPVVSLPTPTVDYTIDNSIDYESYKAGNYDDANTPEFVVIGVDENKNATDYSTTFGQAKSFTPTEIGEYAVEYKVNLRVYSNKYFTYVEGTYDDDLTNYFTLVSEEEPQVQIKTVDANTYKVYKGGETYTITKGEDDVITYTKDSDSSNASNEFASYEVANWYKNLRAYTLTSDTYTITVQDKKGPTIKNYDYVDSISMDDVKTGTYKLKIQGIEATDASGINISKSSVSITTSYKADGTTRTSYDSLTKDELLTGKEKTITLNGTITIAYTVYDNNGNSSTAEYVIKAGDVTDPSITIEDDFVETTYALSDFQDNIFKVDLSKLSYKDNVTSTDNLDLSFKLVNNDTEEEMDALATTDNEVSYEITTVGNYTFSVTVTDETGNFTTREFKFEVTESDVDSTLAYKVIGTVLIVISVLVLAGVIIYFIVSKVKLDKELKK